MISRKYKFHVTLKERLLISLKPQKFVLARSNAKSQSLFIWVVMFNLTIFWVRKTVFSFSEHRNLVACVAAGPRTRLNNLYCPSAN